MIRVLNVEVQQRTSWLQGESPKYVEVKIRKLDVLRVNVHIRGRKNGQRKWGEGK
jgi:hypothetical protein